MSQDLYESPDYFLLDELLTEEHKLIRGAAREWVKREISAATYWYPGYIVTLYS